MMNWLVMQMITDESINQLYEIEKQRILDIADDSTFGENLWNYYQFASWARWYPDLYIELFKSKESNMNLHFDQRVFMRCDIRFQSMYGTFSRGYAKCIKGDSLIFTDNGLYEIGEFFNYQNDDKETHYDTKINVVNRYGKLEKTKLGLYNGKQECITVKTCDGYEITGTKIHKVLVMNTDGKIVFKKLSDIQYGDYVVINRNNNVWGKLNDDSIVENVDINSLTEIPNNILKSTKQVVSSFIIKIFNNSTIIKTRHCKLAKQLQILLLNFGIISRLEYINDIFKITIVNDDIDLNYYYSKVDSISESIEDVYDFHLPETHSFVSNGFVSHNTYTEVLDDFIVATLTPNITLSVTAQTRENSAALLQDKTNEILEHYPLLTNEIEYKRFSKNDALIKFKNGAMITNLANAQSSKGRRRHRIKIEESALLNNTLYEDALAPIVEVPRITSGSLALVDPEEMNFQIHFFTTSGYRGSDEFSRSVRMVNGMRNLSGDIVLGASWKLPCYYGRGSTKQKILDKKRTSNPIFFSQNYEQEWVGCADNALVDVNKLMACRVLEEPILEAQRETDEFVVSVDVARSENTNNNQSAITILKVIRNPVNKRIMNIQVVNVLGVTNKMNFRDQACLIKKLKKQYCAKAIIVDGNGLGSGLVDQLLLKSYDTVTGEYLGCYDTINTDNKPEVEDSEKIVFDMKAQGYQTKVVSYFINAVDSGILQMLVKKQEQDFTDKEREFFDKNVAPFLNTELLFMEITNLKLKVMTGNNLSVEKVVRRIDKDKFSALSYGIFYLMEFCNKDLKQETYNFTSAPICASAVSF